MTKKSMIILYVRDQEKSKTFYEGILNKKPVLHVPGMTEFELGGDVLLGLMPEKSISKILEGKTPSPETGNGIPRCELYLIVEDVNIAYQRAISSGAKEVSAPSARDWGDHVGYCSDPDGHILAFAN